MSATLPKPSVSPPGVTEPTVGSFLREVRAFVASGVGPHPYLRERISEKVSFLASARERADLASLVDITLAELASDLAAARQGKPTFVESLDAHIRDVRAEALRCLREKRLEVEQYGRIQTQLDRVRKRFVGSGDEEAAWREVTAIEGALEQGLKLKKELSGASRIAFARM